MVGGVGGMGVGGGGVDGGLGEGSSLMIGESGACWWGRGGRGCGGAKGMKDGLGSQGGGGMSWVSVRTAGGATNSLSWASERTPGAGGDGEKVGWRKVGGASSFTPPSPELS